MVATKSKRKRSKRSKRANSKRPRLFHERQRTHAIMSRFSTEEFAAIMAAKSPYQPAAQFVREAVLSTLTKGGGK